MNFHYGSGEYEVGADGRVRRVVRHGLGTFMIAAAVFFGYMLYQKKAMPETRAVSFLVPAGTSVSVNGKPLSPMAAPKGGSGISIFPVIHLAVGENTVSIRTDGGKGEQIFKIKVEDGTSTLTYRYQNGKLEEI